MDKQPEFSTPVWDYIAALVDEERVDEGRALLQQHAGSLRAAQGRFGVDPAVIVAVWGVESNFGKNFGKRPVVQSLATLVCEAPRRNEYFKKELMAALKILDHGDIAPQEFNGSWAGAFGHTQFMPSTFLTTAIDLDGDGRKNIASSPADALGSTANFLRKAGWVQGLGWGFEVRLPEGYSGPSGRTNRQSMSAFAAHGVRRLDGGGLGEGRVALLLPAGRNGPAFIVTRNFDAVYGYNAAEVLRAGDWRIVRPAARPPGHSDALADRRSRPVARGAAGVAGAAQPPRLQCRRTRRRGGDGDQGSHRRFRGQDRHEARRPRGGSRC